MRVKRRITSHVLLMGILRPGGEDPPCSFGGRSGPAPGLPKERGLADHALPSIYGVHPA